ncbi:hypothetical protein N0V93_008972 [Gnomoniopsis smithogilvyi]|uniref:Exonuclease domain-containing protein n=1 Tax=Gnomoniopsis smithogilvyi TaxID=1191159 RepID=A0A9W9CS98_9PEZI|nr:hypothetical protein N0V93_008972 [Gnomoniopsis smithogilvyi]
MGTALDGESELIRVTVLDYFTGAALVDSLVWPDVAMEHYNTRWSGVTRAQIRAAKREGTCILGVEAARREVWRYVGVDTIVVGHDVKNDLGALRWAHGVVVDSILVEDAARKALKRANAGKKEAKGGADDSSGDSSKGIDRAAPGDDREEGGRKGQQAAKPKMPGLSLKDVTKLRLARDIQKRTHDSFEDALASRDIVHHYAMAGLS